MIIITADTENTIRLDLFISQKLPDLSRSFVQKLIDQKAIIVNGKVATKASLKINSGDTISIQIPEPVLPTTEHDTSTIPVQIIFEHKDFLVINKPAPLIVHTPGAGHQDATLVDWLINHVRGIKQAGPIERPGIVHRLDKETSGLMLVARTSYGHKILSDLFKDRLIKKSYLALVEGHPATHGSTDLKITRHPTYRTKMAPSARAGREASTSYEVKNYYKKNNLEYALIEAWPVTGRTHQIRVHMTALGHPIIGDKLYGHSSPLIKRQALHAYTLAFEFEGKQYEFKQEPPEDFQHTLAQLTVINHESE